MGTPQTPHPVKLFTGLLGPVSILEKVNLLLEKTWGEIESKSEVHPFHYSHYYDEEMGADLARWFLTFKRCIHQEEIREYKLQSNELELADALEGRRRYNIDPGFVDLDKVVLATTKPATYRIYLGRGIFAQSTLFFKDGKFHPWSWTYADYKDAWALNYFQEVRNKFKNNRL